MAEIRRAELRSWQEEIDQEYFWLESRTTGVMLWYNYAELQIACAVFFVRPGVIPSVNLDS